MFTRLSTTRPAQCRFLPLENKLFCPPSEHGGGPTMHRFQQEAKKKKKKKIRAFSEEAGGNICCLPEIYRALEMISHCCCTPGWDEKHKDLEIETIWGL